MIRPPVTVIAPLTFKTPVWARIRRPLLLLLTVKLEIVGLVLVSLSHAVLSLVKKALSETPGNTPPDQLFVLAQTPLLVVATHDTSAAGSVCVMPENRAIKQTVAILKYFRGFMVVTLRF